MRTLLAFSRLGLLYSFFVSSLGVYYSYVWSERAYEVDPRHSANSSEAEVRIKELERELYFARSKQGSTQAFSHGLAAIFFLSIAAQARRLKGSRENAP